ncbi:MAG: ATPase, T2SS/T4P/T4SS family [Candidatus Ozemobacteraceae bacterium]
MKPIGKILVEAEIITQSQLDQGLFISAEQDLRLGEALIKLGFISEPNLLGALSKQFGIAFLESGELVIDPTVLHEIPAQFARQYTLMPLHNKSGVLVVATPDPTNLEIQGVLEARLKRRVALVLAGREKVLRAIDYHYSGKDGLGESMHQVQLIENEKHDDFTEAREDSAVQSAPVVKFVNQFFMGAVRERASDIHIERDDVDFHIRYRIDGILKTMFRPKFHLHSLIVSRIKVMAKLDVSEHRIPQDGRIKLNIEGQSVDFRVNICPCMDGENVVVRILNRDSKPPDFAQLGFSPFGLNRLEGLLTHNFGLLLVAGQTGSGKTTTLYSILQRLNDEETKIITIEDPVEIRLPMLNQIQVNTKVNLTFASGLRSILRMDPDIILVGEIRDPETAQLAVNAAMTGHLVLSTIHCGVSGEVPVRLSEMGIQPYLTANVLHGTIAQRLVRLNCSHCLEPEPLPRQLAERFKPDFQSFRGKGCGECAGIGYRGRACVEEVMVVDEPIRQLILDRGTNQQIEAEAVSSGMITLHEAGIEKVRAGLTSFVELARVL